MRIKKKRSKKMWVHPRLVKQLYGVLFLLITAACLWGVTSNASAQGVNIGVINSVESNEAKVGDVVTYTYTIINSGDVTVSGVTVTDSFSNRFTTVLQNGDNGTVVFPLGVGVVTYAYTVTESDLVNGSITNTVSVTTEASTIVFSSNVVTVAVKGAEIEVFNEVNPNVAAVGEVITYTYTIMNTGSVTLSEVALVDSLGNAFTVELEDVVLWTAGTWQQATVTQPYTVTEADLVNGLITNIVTATAVTTQTYTTAVTDGTRASSSDSTTVTVMDDASCATVPVICGLVWLDIDGILGFSNKDWVLTNTEVIITSDDGTVHTVVETDEDGWYRSNLVVDGEIYYVSVVGSLFDDEAFITDEQRTIAVTVGVDNINNVSFQYTLDPYGDIDGDELLNGWEIFGHGGVNLPAMGAHPLRKDVFVEIDYMVKYMRESTIVDYSHQPVPIAIYWIVEAYKNAPTVNFDGTSGIRLHVDYGVDAPLYHDIGGTWGDLSHGEELAHRYILCDRDNGVGIWDAFDEIKAGAFNQEREGVFHYSMWAHRLCDDTGTISGLARHAPGRDFIVSLGGWRDNNVGYNIDQAGVFMHELGHVLGLHHGGHDHENYKPNYFSVMNYLYMIGLIPNRNNTPVFNYSIYDTETYINLLLNEHSLHENHGFVLPSELSQYPNGTISDVRYWCYGEDGRYARLVPFEQTINWNCQNGIDLSPVQVDLNDSGGESGLHVWNDWLNLQFTGLSDEYPPIDTTNEEEMTFELLDAIIRGITGVELTLTTSACGDNNGNTVRFLGGASTTCDGDNFGNTVRFLGGASSPSMFFASRQYCWSSTIDGDLGCTSEFVAESRQGKTDTEIAELEQESNNDPALTPVRFLSVGRHQITLILLDEMGVPVEDENGNIVTEVQIVDVFGTAEQTATPTIAQSPGLIFPDTQVTRVYTTDGNTSQFQLSELDTDISVLVDDIKANNLDVGDQITLTFPISGTDDVYTTTVDLGLGKNEIVSEEGEVVGMLIVNGTVETTAPLTDPVGDSLGDVTFTETYSNGVLTMEITTLPPMDLLNDPDAIGESLPLTLQGQAGEYHADFVPEPGPDRPITFDSGDGTIEETTVDVYGTAPREATANAIVTMENGHRAFNVGTVPVFETYTADGWHIAPQFDEPITVDVGNIDGLSGRPLDLGIVVGGRTYTGTAPIKLGEQNVTLGDSPERFPVEMHGKQTVPARVEITTIEVTTSVILRTETTTVIEQYSADGFDIVSVRETIEIERSTSVTVETAVLTIFTERGTRSRIIARQAEVTGTVDLTPGSNQMVTLNNGALADVVVYGSMEVPADIAIFDENGVNLLPDGETIPSIITYTDDGELVITPVPSEIGLPRTIDVTQPVTVQISREQTTSTCNTVVNAGTNTLMLNNLDSCPVSSAGTFLVSAEITATFPNGNIIIVDDVMLRKTVVGDQCTIISIEDEITLEIGDLGTDTEQMLTIEVSDGEHCTDKGTVSMIPGPGQLTLNETAVTALVHLYGSVDVTFTAKIDNEHWYDVQSIQEELAGRLVYGTDGTIRGYALEMVSGTIDITLEDDAPTQIANLIVEMENADVQGEIKLSLGQHRVELRDGGTVIVNVYGATTRQLPAQLTLPTGIQFCNIVTVREVHAPDGITTSTSEDITCDLTDRTLSSGQTATVTIGTVDYGTIPLLPGKYTETSEEDVTVHVYGTAEITATFTATDENGESLEINNPDTILTITYTPEQSYIISPTSTTPNITTTGFNTATIVVKTEFPNLQGSVTVLEACSSTKTIAFSQQAESHVTILINACEPTLISMVQNGVMVSDVHQHITLLLVLVIITMFVVYTKRIQDKKLYSHLTRTD